MSCGLQRLSVSFIILLILSTVDQSRTAAQTDKPPYPAARRAEQMDKYHGVAVPDPYRWLEQIDSDETKAWVQAQDELLQSRLADVPARAAIRARLTELAQTDSYSVPRKANGQYFYTYSAAGRPRGQSVVCAQESLGGRPRALFDGRTRLGDDATISWIAPSPDGRALAYSIRQKQSRWATLRVLDVATGADMADTMTGAHTVTGGISWTKDSKGFFYSALDLPGAGQERQAVVRNPKIYYHTLGQPQTKDALVLALPNEPNALFTHRVTDDGKYIIVAIHDGGGPRNRILYQDLSAPEAGLKTIIPQSDATYTFLGNEGERCWFYTDLNAPRGRIVAIDLAKPQREYWREVVAQMKEAINGRDQTGGNALGMYGNRFVLMYVRDGRPLVRIFDTRGKLRRELAPPIGGSIWAGFVGAQRDPEVFYWYLGWTDPSTVYRLNVVTGRNTAFKRAPVKFDSSRYVVKQVFYRGKDGTRVPLFLIHRKDLKLDGDNPAYMYGYGGMGWVSFPWFQPHRLAWLEIGGVYAQPSLRGGGEYGETWHQAGIKQNKQNTIDDFLAAAEWLIANKYASAKKLVATGGSLSGPLAAAAIQQRPDLFGASTIAIPVLDLLRFDQFTGGAYWRSELGSPSDPVEFKTLLASSPYHNVKRGQCYPPTLVMAGEWHQPAVPTHDWKFTAAMQAAQGCDNAVLLKTMKGAGHNYGGTAEQTVDSYTDELTFLARSLRLSPALVARQ